METGEGILRLDRWSFVLLADRVSRPHPPRQGRLRRRFASASLPLDPASAAGKRHYEEDGEGPGCRHDEGPCPLRARWDGEQGRTARSHGEFDQCPELHIRRSSVIGVRLCKQEGQEFESSRLNRTEVQCRSHFPTWALIFIRPFAVSELVACPMDSGVLHGRRRQGWSCGPVPPTSGSGPQTEGICHRSPLGAWPGSLPP